MGVRRERWGGKEGRAGGGCRGGMGEGGWGEEGRGGMQGEECGKGRAGEAGKRAPAAGGREGLPCEEGGAGITGPSQPRAPRPGGASSPRGGRGAAGRYGAPLLPGSRSPRPREDPPLHLLSPTTALRPMGAIVLRESRAPSLLRRRPWHGYLPGSARSAGHSPPLRNRARAQLTRGLAAEARREPERGCRPAGARAGGAGRGRGLVPAVSVTRAPPPIALRPGSSAPPAEMRLDARRSLAGAKAAPSPSPHAQRAPCCQSRAPGAQGPKVPSAASAPGHRLLTSSLFLKPHYVLSFLFLGTLHFSPAHIRNSETPNHNITGG